MNRAEHALQQRVYAWLRAALPDASVMSIDAAFAADSIVGKLRKERGIRAGAPDVTAKPPDHPRIWWELKAGAGRPTEAQRAMHAELRAAGETVFVARSVSEVAEQLRSLGIEPRIAAPIEVILPPVKRTRARKPRLVKRRPSVAVARTLWGA